MITAELARKRINKALEIIVRHAMTNRSPQRTFSCLEVDLMLEEIAAAIKGEKPNYAPYYECYKERTIE